MGGGERRQWKRGGEGGIDVQGRRSPRLGGLLAGERDEGVKGRGQSSIVWTALGEMSAEKAWPAKRGARAMVDGYGDGTTDGRGGFLPLDASRKTVYGIEAREFRGGYVRWRNVGKRGNSLHDM